MHLTNITIGLLGLIILFTQCWWAVFLIHKPKNKLIYNSKNKIDKTKEMLEIIYKRS